MIKSRRIRGAGHVVCMEEISTFWLESLKGRDHSKDLGVKERIILNWTFRK
jgi:hypothetical protein